MDVCEYTRKHTTNVHEALSNIKQMLARLVETRDQRRDTFAKVIKKAMSTTLGAKTEEVIEVLRKHGIQKAVADQALKLAAPSIGANSRFSPSWTPWPAWRPRSRTSETARKQT